MDMRNYFERIVNLFVGVIVVILGLRILFRLFDANASAGFVEWIYETSEVIMAPFRGVFPPATIEPGITFDIPAIFAAIMYALIGMLLIGAASLVPAQSGSRSKK